MRDALTDRTRRISSLHTSESAYGTGKQQTGEPKQMKVKRAEHWPTGSRGQRKPWGTGKRSQILEGRLLGRNQSSPAALPPNPPGMQVDLTHSLSCKINYAGEFRRSISNLSNSGKKLPSTLCGQIQQEPR